MMRILIFLYPILFLFLLAHFFPTPLVNASNSMQGPGKLNIPKALYSSSFNREPSYVPGGDEFYPFYGNNAMFGDDNLWSSALSRHLRFHMRTPIGRRASLPPNGRV